MFQWLLAETADYSDCGLWVGASEESTILFSLDKENWQVVGAIETCAIIGSVSEWPLVVIDPDQMLRSIPQPGNSNMLWVCGEIISFADADLVAPNTYKLSNMLRGMRGTREHAPRKGELVMLMDEGITFLPIRPDLLGVTAYWKVVQKGKSATLGEIRPYCIGGLKYPNPTGPSVSLSPKEEIWGNRYLESLTDNTVCLWADAWVKTKVEIGTILSTLPECSIIVWTGQEWKTVSL